jgi:hypothetical protein
VPAHDRTQGVRDRGRVDFAIDRDDGLRASRRAVRLRHPEVLLLWRSLKTVCSEI